MQIKLLVEGGSMKPGPSLSQKIGPVGIPINKVISQVNEATKNFSGIKVPVELNVNSSTKEFEIKVFSPPVSELLKKELGISKSSALQKKMQVANASIEQIISVAKTKLPNLLCKNLKSAVKIVVGSCVSAGILIESKSAVEIEQDIDSGKYDKEIKQELTKTSPEKRKELDEYFSKIKSAQDKIIKKEQAEKEAADEAKESSKKVKTVAVKTADEKPAPAKKKK